MARAPNTAIPLGVQPVQIESPMNALAKVLQVQGFQQEQQLGRMKMQEYERGVQEQNRLADMYRSGADSNALRRAGFGKQALEWDEKTAEIDQKRAQGKKAEADVRKIDFDTEIKRIEHVSSVLSTAKDPQSYEVARMTLAQQFGQDILGKLPQQFDPAALQATIAQGMTIAQRLADERVRQQQAETGRHNRTTEANSAGQLMVAQSNLALRSQELDHTKKKDAAQLVQDQGGGGPVLGVPVPGALPWGNQSNPKDANKVKAQEISRGSKEIEKDVDAARKEAATAAAATRFIELNKKISTGGLTDKVGLGRWAQSMGDEYAEMEAITAKLAPAMREPGSGSTSDFDGKQFERATVGVDKPGKANTNIAKGIIARAQQAQEYADFRQTYLEQNGTLQGADRHWKDYVNKNPIFDPAKDGAYELNAKRKSWSEHFKGGNKAPAAAPTAGGLSQAELAELQELRKRLGK